MSPLFDYFSGKIESLQETVESEVAINLLTGIRQSLITACDPLNCNKDEFKRVLLVLQTVNSLVSMGVFDLSEVDGLAIVHLCAARDLPTNL